MSPDAIMYLIPLAGMATGALFMVGVYKILMRWIDSRQKLPGASTDEIMRLREEVERLGDLRERVLELEERQDFAERLLARGGKEGGASA